MKKIIVLILVFGFAASPHALADDVSAQKLQRGLVNIVTAPLELPKQIRASWITGSEKTMHISAWLFYGFVKGLWMAPLRLGSGLWDIVSFPFDLPGNGAGVISPEYVFDDWPKREKGIVYKNLWDK